MPEGGTAPNVPALVPPDRLRPKAALVRPVTAFPVASLTVIVTTSEPPEKTVGAAKLADEVEPLTGPGVTVTVGCAVSVTPLTVAVRLPAVPAVAAVNVAVY